MAAPTGTARTTTQVGNREDLTDVISRVAPEKTPFTSNCGKAGKASAIRHEWQLEDLATPDPNNARLEGSDARDAEENVTERVSNICQIFDKVFAVSGTQEKVSKAGRTSEVARQSRIKGIEMKRDKEAAYLSANASRLESGVNARKLGGIRSWIETNVSRGTGGSDGGYNSGTSIVDAPTAGAPRVFTEGLLKTVMQSRFDNTGDMPGLTMYTDSFNKIAFSAFTGISEIRTPNSTGMAEIVGAADVYQSDFGRVTTVPLAYGLSGAALIVDHEYVGSATLRGIERVKLAKTGDNVKYQMICEDTLVCKNEKSLALVDDLTTS